MGKRAAVTIPDGYVSLPDFQLAKGCSRSSIYRRFKPVRFGGRAYLPASALDVEMGEDDGRDPIVAKAAYEAVLETRECAKRASLLQAEVSRLERAEAKRKKILMEAESMKQLIDGLEKRKAQLEIAKTGG